GAASSGCPGSGAARSAGTGCGGATGCRRSGTAARSRGTARSNGTRRARASCHSGGTRGSRGSRGLMRALVVGRGAREHALAWKLAQSPGVERLFCAPGNAGTETLSESVPVRETDIAQLVGFARQNRIDLVVIGPEAPLALGLADAIAEAEIRVFGPRRAAAEIESSKTFAKSLMQRE